MGAGRWCEIGKAPDDWAPLKTCPAAIGSSTVKILNYNLFWWNLFERRHGENGRAGRKIASTSQPEEYDFMGFQECKDVNRVMRDAKRHGLSGDYDTLSLVKDDRALGLAYLKSRWNLIASGWEDVGEDSSQQYYGRRAAQWARLQRKDDNATAFLINHHGPLPVSASGGCAGSATAYNILRVIAQNAHVSDLVILVGDFNAQHHSSRIQTLSKHMNKIFSGTSHGGVDHIFSNCGEGSAIVSATNIGTGGSDHDALNVVLNLGDAPVDEPEPVDIIENEQGAEDTCCSNCAGHSHCSPNSGNCYDWQKKPYYRSC